MTQKIGPLSFRYAIAVVTVGLLAGIKLGLDPLIGVQNPFLLFLTGVMFCAWLGGIGPGLFATLLAGLVSDLLFLTPGQILYENPVPVNVQLGLFVAEGAVVSWGTASLHRALGELREADRHKDNFLGILAHELRNHLAPIKYSLKALQFAAGNPELEEQARQTMERQLQQMARLIDDVLDLARVRAGKIEFCPRPTDLAGVLTDAVEASRPLMEKLGHELTVTLPLGPLCVDADPGRLTQAVANLLNNAAKYTPERGHVTLFAKQVESEVEIGVRDNGMGIPTDLLPRIFDLFMQVDGSRSRARGGLGIGLSLVRQIVEMHGGTVHASSAGPGQGSEFRIRLPIAQENNHPSQPRDDG
jgi:signal transduction histidine kinase